MPNPKRQFWTMLFQHLLPFALFLRIISCFYLVGSFQVEETTEYQTTDVTELNVQENTIRKELDFEKLVQKLHSYVLYSPGFGNYSKQDFRNFIKDLDTWEEPKYFQDNFPYYFAGYDPDNSPVWIAEIGKYNIHHVVENGEKSVEALLKYVFKAIYRIIKTIHEKDTPEKEFRHSSFILDFDGFDMYQISHINTLSFMLRVVRDYKEVIDEFMGYCMVINVNPLAQHFLDMMRPILGRVFERIETYGTNRAKWIPMVRRRFPDYLIPASYGGNPAFKPIKVYG